MNKVEASLVFDKTSTFKRSQYVCEMGIVNGLGLNVAVVDRRGGSVILPNTMSRGYEGGLYFAYRHTMVVNGALNTLQSVHQDSKMSRVLNATRRNKEVEYTLVINYDQLTEVDWFYDDRLDVMISIKYDNTPPPPLPRFGVENVVNNCIQGDNANILYIRLVGEWHSPHGYIKVGSEYVKIFVEKSNEPPYLLISGAVDGKTYCHRYAHIEELKNTILDEIPVIDKIVDPRIEAVLSELKKCSALCTSLIKELNDALSGPIKDIEAFNNIINTLSDNSTMEDKRWSERLKMMSTVSSTIKSVI